MKKIISILAYCWAFVCLLVIPLTFFGNDSFAQMLAKLSFMKINPIYSGGEVAREIKHDEYITFIYKPVFAALIGESSKGFVQVKWKDDKNLPTIIKDSIDYDNNGTIDFKVEIDTQKAKTTFTGIDKKVLGLEISAKVKNDWLIRVNLINNAN